MVKPGENGRLSAIRGSHRVGFQPSAEYSTQVLQASCSRAWALESFDIAVLISDIETGSSWSYTASTYIRLTSSRRFERSRRTAKTTSQSWLRGEAQFSTNLCRVRKAVHWLSGVLIRTRQSRTGKNSIPKDDILMSRTPTRCQNPPRRSRM